MLDLLIKNARVADGTGKPVFSAAVGVEGDRIACIVTDGTLPEAKTVIDAKGQLLCPGFIDIHSHADVSLPFYPHADNSIMQGITTFVGSNCGMGLAPAYNEEFVQSYMMKQLQLEGCLEVKWKSFGEWLDHVRGMDIGLNYIPLVGLNALRGSVLGNDCNRAATESEQDAICALLEEAMDAGAFGLSYSADPGTAGHHADKTEMERLFRLLEKRRAYVTAHTRHHQNQWPSDDGRSYYGVFVGETGDVLCGRYHGLLEFMELFRKTPGVTAVYSHITNAFVLPMPHSQELEDAMIDETLRTFVDGPAAEGYRVYFNVLTHEHSLSSIQRVAGDLIKSLNYDPELKAYANEAALVHALADPAFREKLKTYIKSGKFKMGMLSPATDPYWGDCYAFFTAKDESLLGRTLTDVTRQRRPGRTTTQRVYDDCIDVLFDLLADDPGLEWALIRDKREYQGTRRLLSNPRGLPMTDAPAFPAKSDKWISPMGYGNPPLAYSSFVRYLIQQSRDDGPLTMEEAIRKITSLPAEIMEITDRGSIAPGMKADLVLLDWEDLGYTVDFNDPSIQPDGIRYVWVNGVPALAEGQLTHALTGQVITRA